MQILKTKSEMRKWSEKQRTQGHTIGFVPTMGALHEGHLSLIREARKNNDLVIASIFVNPTQFGPNEDLSSYPRPFEHDVKLLQSEGCDILFHPSAEEMYDTDERLSSVVVKKLPNHLCGLSRPGHFQGVTTVVLKLLNITLPHRAYFGRKDYQQFLIIKKMAKDLDLFVEIVDCPIVREQDGLAMSSRNQYLSNTERAKATVLYKALKTTQQSVADGERNTKNLIAEMKKTILSEAPESKIDYLKIVDSETLEDLEKIDKKAVAALAVYFGKARLIDNILLEI